MIATSAFSFRLIDCAIRLSGSCRSLSPARSHPPYQLGLVDDLDAELARFLQLAPRVRPHDNEAVFLETLPDTRPPFPSMSAAACSRDSVGSVPVMTIVRPFRAPPVRVTGSSNLSPRSRRRSTSRRARASVNQPTIDSAILSPIPCTLRMSSTVAREDGVHGAEVPGDLARRRLADVLDSEAEEQPRERLRLGGRDGLHEVRGALFGQSFEPSSCSAVRSYRSAASETRPASMSC